MPSIKENATKQEIFEQVAKHLFAQGERAGDFDENGGVCKHIDKTGKMCAVGCLMDVEVAKEIEALRGNGVAVYNILEELEGSEHGLYLDANNKPVHLPLELKNKLGFINRETIKLLNQLQSLHDLARNWCSTSKMREELVKVARANDLDATILDSLSFPNR